MQKGPGETGENCALCVENRVRNYICMYKTYKLLSESDIETSQNLARTPLESDLIGVFRKVPKLSHHGVRQMNAECEELST